MDREEFRNAVHTMFANGATVVEVAFTYEEKIRKQKLRLFMSTSKVLAYKGKGRRRYGRAIEDFAYQYPVISVRDVTPKVKKDDSVSSYIADVRKFKKAFLEKAHENVWQDIVYNYGKLDVEDLEKYIRENSKEMLPSHYDCYILYRKYAEEHGIEHLIFENRYKTVTIKSFNPMTRKNWRSGYGYTDYQAAIDTIQERLDKKIGFEYHWRAGYDITVSGRLCEDGKYRAWMSVEFKNCGNGHYYLLINANTAVFCEDD